MIDDIAEERQRAEVFDALSHPARILILKELNEENLGFAELKKKLGIESSGHLQHHLNKLGSLVKTDEYGKYTLTDQGKDALLSVETVEKVAGFKTRSGKKSFDKDKRRFVIWIAVFTLILLLVASSIVAILQYNQTFSLQNQLREEDNFIKELFQLIASQNSVSSPSPTIIPPVLPTTEFILSQYSVNLTQGGQVNIDITVKSLENQATTKSIGITLLGYNNAAWSSGDPQRIFNATFTTNPLFLGPQESKSTIMKLQIADDAPLGRYIFAVGNVEFTVMVISN
jgi:DNA-binding HxlR family transcriptional regulator